MHDFMVTPSPSLRGDQYLSSIELNRMITLILKRIAHKRIILYDNVQAAAPEIASFNSVVGGAGPARTLGPACSQNLAVDFCQVTPPNGAE
ncbi:hypothetical protein EVAR_41094_1 [Eumeta japonica]|uniref:Uncharacterized protein n=1 Tax=Eumeta variegata TaxID=151549 RepID=A0A4C1XEZ7_EUMVA|nr:hypothetical protein EVAR_41094_1 [Eumeta japonica]